MDVIHGGVEQTDVMLVASNPNLGNHDYNTLHAYTVCIARVALDRTSFRIRDTLEMAAWSFHEE